jgi:hypothetical protein
VAECFRFPLADEAARRDLLVGGTWLLTLPVGWILNLGHRLDVVARVFHDDPPFFRGFRPWSRTFRRGLRAFAAIALYLSPSVVLSVVAALAWRSGQTGISLGLAPVAAVLFLLAIYALPGGMTYNAAFDDLSYLYRPDRAFRRALEGGTGYLRAWAIALLAMALSMLGLLGLGIGFFYTSVWAWTVVGHAFSRALVMAGAGPTERVRQNVPGGNCPQGHGHQRSC